MHLSASTPATHPLAAFPVMLEKLKRIPHDVALKYVHSVWGGGTKSAHRHIINIFEPSGALLGQVKNDCTRRTLCWSAVSRPQDQAPVQYVGCTTPQCQFFSPSFQPGQFDNSCSSNGEYPSILYKFIITLFSIILNPIIFHLRSGATFVRLVYQCGRKLAISVSAMRVLRSKYLILIVDTSIFSVNLHNLLITMAFFYNRNFIFSPSSASPSRYVCIL